MGGDLLAQWEGRTGLSRLQMLLLAVAASIFVLMLVCFIFGSKPATDASSSDSEGAAHHLAPESEEELKDKRSVTTMGISFDKDGQMHTETTTETTGIDKNGNQVATRETKKGDAANRETEKIMGGLGQMMGGLGPVGAMMGIMNQMFRPRDPLEELVEDLMAMSAADVLAHRRPSRGPGFHLIPAHMLGLPSGHAHTHGHVHTHTPEINVTKPVRAAMTAAKALPSA